MMRKCRICGKPANDVVGSYNYTSWMCDEHVDVFISLAIHWKYQEHQAVMYVDPESEVLDAKIERVRNLSPNSTLQIRDTLQTRTKIAPKEDYSGALYDPEARGFARPKSKHLKVYPRWTGMETHDADEKHGEVHEIRKSKARNLSRMKKNPTETDYASKGIIWDSPTIYTKG